MSPNFNIGDLPYGYNPNSPNSLTIPDNGWSGTLWNLNNQQVRSQMTLPLFANQNASLGLYNQGNIFPGNGNQTGDFYSSLLQAQASQGGISQPNSGGDVPNFLNLLMAIKKAQQAEKKSKEATSDTESANGDDNSTADSAEAEEAKTGKKKFAYDSDSPLKALKKFVKNSNDDSTFKFEDYASFEENTYAKLKGEDGKVKLNTILDTFGIDMSSIKKDKQLEISESVTDSNNVQQSEYGEILSSLDLDAESATLYTSKKDFIAKRDEFIGTSSASDEADKADSTDEASTTRKSKSIKIPKAATEEAKSIAEMMRNLASDKEKDPTALRVKLRDMSPVKLHDVMIEFNRMQKENAKTSEEADRTFEYFVDNLKPSPGDSEETTKSWKVSLNNQIEKANAYDPEDPINKKAITARILLTKLNTEKNTTTIKSYKAKLNRLLMKEGKIDSTVWTAFDEYQNAYGISNTETLSSIWDKLKPSQK